MEKLYELHDETDFDLVVVDTPPTRNALDFLDAPRRLSRFLDHRLFRLLIAPEPRASSRRSTWPPRRSCARCRKVVGGEVVDDAVAFFQAFEGMEEGFRQRAARVQRAALGRRHRLRAGGVAPARHGGGGPLLRRAAGRGRHRGARRWSSTGCTRRSASTVTARATVAAVRSARRPRVTALAADDRTLGRACTATSPTSSRSPAASRPTSRASPSAVAPAPVVRVPFLRSDVHDLGGLAEVAVARVRARLPEPGLLLVERRRRRRRGRRPPPRRSR